MTNRWKRIEGQVLSRQKMLEKDVCGMDIVIRVDKGFWRRLGKAIRHPGSVSSVFQIGNAAKNIPPHRMAGRL